MASSRTSRSLGLSLPSTPPASSCPCGRGAPLSACCGPVHADHARAQTAEQLMRARYSAFVLGRHSFLETTWHPTSRPRRIDLDDDTEWLGLTITELIAGGPEDQAGEVAFVARFRNTAARNAMTQELVEHSRFVRVDGRWLYLDAIG